MSIFKQKVKSSQSFDQVPPGNHGAVLVAIVDLGTHEENFQGKINIQRKIYFVWELTSEKEPGAPDKNRLIAKMFTLSFGKKAKLRALIEGWRGKALDDGEEFDLAKLIGKSCLVNVVHDNEYANVAAVSAPPKGVKVEKPKHTPFIWEIEGDKPVDLSWLPWIYGKKVEDVIAQSDEVTGNTRESANGKLKSEETIEEVGQEEEIPF